MAQGQGQEHAQAQGSILEPWQTGISISIPCSFLAFTLPAKVLTETPGGENA